MTVSAARGAQAANPTWPPFAAKACQGRQNIIGFDVLMKCSKNNMSKSVHQ
jgi:hypothetical protein